MNMTEVKVDSLASAALDWAVAKSLGVTVRVLSTDNPGELWQVQKQWRGDGPYWPSQDWAQGGMILEANDWVLPYRATHRYHLGKYEACTPGGFPHNGPTPLIAAMRAIVAAKLGDVVSVPSELLEVAK